MSGAPPEVRPLDRAEIAARLYEVAGLRIAVFRDWPYLYDGDPAYERRYLAPYVGSAESIVVGAFDGDTLVGAATGTPIEDHADEFGAALAGLGVAPHRIFYCAESVLLPRYRGLGIGHRFFDLREAHALDIGRTHAAFCAVARPPDHPARPSDARTLAPFWRKRGYRELPGVVARFAWRDVGEAKVSEKPMQFWIKRLVPWRDADLAP